MRDGERGERQVLDRVGERQQPRGQLVGAGDVEALEDVHVDARR